MMCKFKNNAEHSRIDQCMKPLIEFLKKTGLNPVACCCGHGKYPMTVVIYDKYFKETYELFSEKDIPRKRKYYKRDNQGYYFIPETTQNIKRTFKHQEFVTFPGFNKISQEMQ